MTFNSLPSERVAVVAAIDPDAYTADTYVSGWVKADKFERFMAVIMAGTLGSSGTVDAKIVQGNTAAGGGAKDVTGKAITQLTQAGTDSDKQAIINVSADDLDHENGFHWLAVSMTVGTATSDAGAVLLAIDAKFRPASDNDAATVDSIA